MSCCFEDKPKIFSDVQVAVWEQYGQRVCISGVRGLKYGQDHPLVEATLLRFVALLLTVMCLSALSICLKLDQLFPPSVKVPLMLLILTQAQYPHVQHLQFLFFSFHFATLFFFCLKLTMALRDQMMLSQLSSFNRPCSSHA